MTPNQLYELYSLEIEGKDKLNPVAISPIITDIQENDRPIYQQLMKLLNVYKRNLCVRVMDNRQKNISFDFEEEL